MKFEAGEHPVKEMANGRTFWGGLTVVDCFQTRHDLIIPADLIGACGT